MKANLMRLPYELGALGSAALVLLAAVAAFHMMVLRPMEARKADLAERVARQRPLAAEAGPATAADKIAAVYRHLEKQEETTDWLAKLHGIGTATGVQLRSASYREQKTEGRIVRYEMVLPVSGSYAQLRDFLSRARTEIPVLSIDQLTLRRETRTDGDIQAELRLTFHMVRP